ncbi:MAG TPA: protein phosphatase 2C domain-containing protein, partial [Polyangiaceae bacterium]
MTELDLSALPLEVFAAGETDRGCKRASNEDTLLVRSDLGLYVVADGAGGHNAGNVASAIATSAVAKHFDASEIESRDRPEIDAFGLWTAARRLSSSVQRANTAVIEIARSANKYRGMGTTIVCALLVPETGRLHIAHVGDSRCYRLRSGTLELLTHDHSILNDVMELYADLDDAALTRLPRKVITRALGLDEQVRVSVRTFQARVGDRYLLCSDGLTGELRESLLENLLGQ